MDRPNGCRLLIVAGSFQQAEGWRKSNGYSPAEVTYVSSWTTVMGLGGNYRVVRVGTWARRVDIAPINQAIRMAGLREMGE